MSETQGLSERQDLIATILKYQDLDSLLRLSVVLCNLELQGDGCSLFLRQPERDDLELKESTVLTRFLGQPLNIDTEYERVEAEKIRALLATQGKRPEELNRTLTAEEIKAWDPDLVDHFRRFGLTRWAVQFRCPLVVDIQRDVRWSLFEHLKTDVGHCELTRDQVGSIAITILGQESEGLPRGALRVVKAKDKSRLNERDLEWLCWFAENVENHMAVAGSLTELMEVGARLKFDDFGDNLVRLLQKVFNARGCSIFLELGPAGERVKTFQCIATTGLHYKDGQRVIKEDARYQVDMDQKESDSLTGWVLRHGQLLALEKGSWEFETSRYPGLTRKPGHGIFREAEPNDPSLPAGPLLICPLFLHQGREVAGAIRLVRPWKAKSFEPHQEMLFLDISRRLSRVLTNLNLRQVSEELIKLYNKPNEMLRRVPLEVCRLLGVEGCSVFRLREGRYLQLAASMGFLDGLEGKIVYDITDPETRGKTGWVAYRKRALLINTPDEPIRIDPDDPPRHSPENSKARYCEIGERAYRFLAVPIFSEPENPQSEVVGVIRAPRRIQQPPFVEVIHQSILVSFAARLSLAWNMARRNESLEAVAKLADPVNVLEDSSGDKREDPGSIAKEVIERTVVVLIEQVGLASAAIYRLDERTGTLRLLHYRSTLDSDQPCPEMIWRSDDENPIGLDGQRLGMAIRQGDARIGMVVYRTYNDKSLTDRQNSLLGLATGICASVLYNEATFNKLKCIRQGLVRVGQEVTSESSLAKKLEAIAEVAADVTQADNVIIHEYVAPPLGKSAIEGGFRESARGGPVVPAEWKQANFEPGAVPFKVVLLKEPVFEKVAAESEVLFHLKRSPNFIQREGMSSAAALPLNVSGTCVGCIFFNFQKEQQFNARHRQEIQMMAEYAAAAIYQGRLLEETRQLVQEKSHLLRYADHSLAQPLNALMGFLDNLAEGVYFSQLTREKIEDAESFRASQLALYAKKQSQLCNYVAYLVETFLRIDDVEIGRLFEINPRGESDLSGVCYDAVGVAEAYLSGSIHQRIEDKVYGNFDSNAIRTAILNVLVNAVKYGGRTDARTQSPSIRLSLFADRRAETDWATVWIDDSGPGIPKKETISLFERGYRGDSGSSPGLGIGLFLTRGYVEAHGGNIVVEDSDLGGARFVIRLPLN